LFFELLGAGLQALPFGVAERCLDECRDFLVVILVDLLHLLLEGHLREGFLPGHGTS
jgi:hypothetical protein